MIYVHRDWGEVPANAIDELQAAAIALDAIGDKEARKKYIKDNADKWTALREFLSGMSHRKCWYSEARECVSRYHVDHFRPHGRAKQAAKNYAEGYSWLAFDLENLRLAGVLCNTVNQEYSDESVGKGDWFPLVDPAVRASLANRNLNGETPILLDPTDPDDPPKIIFSDDGAPAPSPTLVDQSQEQVRHCIRILGLDQSLLNEARRKKWRQCSRMIVKFELIAKKPRRLRTAEETAIVKELAGELMGMSKAESEFSAVVRSCLTSNKLDRFIIRNELDALAVVD